MKERILVPVNGQQDADRIVPILQDMIDRGGVSEAILVRVRPRTPLSVADHPLDPADVARADADTQEESMRFLGYVAGRIGWGAASHDLAAILGDEAESIARIARERGIDSVLMVTREQSRLGRLLFRSAIDRVLESVCVPITVLRGRGCPAESRACA